ncbi:MAG: response regulator [Polyangiaceae bacterium]|nr:response regulator [Polyangiaceae bacterium]
MSERESNEARLRALNAVLRVAAAHPSLLNPSAFEELADALGQFVQFRAVGLLIPEAGAAPRLYGVSRGQATLVAPGRAPGGAPAAPSPGAPPPFGARFSVSDEDYARVFEAGEVLRCDDTLAGNERERERAERGVRSYLALPARARRAPEDGPGDGGVAAALLVAFSEPGAAGPEAAQILIEVADVLGVCLGRALRSARAEQEAAERLARIRELEEQHRALLDNAPLVIFRLDPRTDALVFLSRHAERLLGVPIAEALSTPAFLRDVHADADGVTSFEDAIARAKLGAASQPYEARISRRGDEAITARVTVFPILSDRGAVVAVEGVLADVSAENAARTRLVQLDRLSTLGTLAAGVAHEINNPAAFITLAVGMLERILRGPQVRMDAGSASSAADLLRELRESIQRITEITKDLRLFAGASSTGSDRRALIDVNRSVESAISLTRGQITERAEIVLRLSEVPPVLMDEGRLGQVIVNLLVNAAQAIPKPGSRQDARAHSITVETRTDGRVVQIEVRDTGGGISPEVLPRIWTPFFTTKSPEVGTGLGLSISREIIERAGGRIRVESPVTVEGVEPPRGTRFVITLPVEGRTEVITPVTAPTPRLVSERVRVLVVEDEAPLARMLAQQLGRVHDIQIAENADAALRLLAQGERFEAVLCDIRMPGMSGDALYGRIRELDPALARGFIFMTGVGFGADVERFLATSGCPLLEKPFKTEDALAAIAEVVTKNRAEKA